jgi:GTPase SAR1 family protein
MSQRMKIIVVGPKGAGKSTISNFLLGQTEALLNTSYQPTVGCRILEGDISGSGNQVISVELWDASGDNR